MDGWLQQFFYALVPGKCILCEARTHRYMDLCIDCENNLPRVANPCRRCGLPILPPATACPACSLEAPLFERCFAPFVYRWPVDRLINDFKNRNRLILGRVLAQAMATSYVAATRPEEMPDVLLPVPLHKRRLRARGFNQSLEIAEVLADLARVPLDNRLCRRIREGEPQKSLPAIQRRQNLRGAYMLDRSPLGEHIAIVDDVITTAATANEIARLALRNGAARVQVIGLARTLR